MRPLALAFVLLLAGCVAPPAAMPASPSPEASASATVGEGSEAGLCPDGSPMAPPSHRFSQAIPASRCPFVPAAPQQPFVQPPPAPQVPMPEVALRRSVFTVVPAPIATRIAPIEPASQYYESWARTLMDQLDNFRGHARIGPVTDQEWDSRVWPGPFQQVARAAAAAKPTAGRFFHMDAISADAGWSLPWKGQQFVDLTLRFRDHAENPPAEGELSYVWHLRAPTDPTGYMFAIADGYDGVSAKSWMNPNAAYYSPGLLETEATSAVAGYLWNESYVPGGNQQFAMVRDTTPFWRTRIEAMNQLNALFMAGTLTARRFEDVSVRIDRFEPLTSFGGGLVTVTILGRLREVLNGKTITEPFTQPMKFFRFGGSGANISGWTAVDSQEDGVWLSGGNLALDKLETIHG